MDRGTSSYAYLSAGRPKRRRHLFRTAHLNATGWLFLIGLMVVVGLVFYGVATAVGLVVWLAVIVGLLGSLLVPVIILGLDRRKWATMCTRRSWDDDAAEVTQVGHELQLAGYPVEVDTSDPDRTHLLYRNRDAKRIEAELVRRGVIYRFD